VLLGLGLGVASLAGTSDQLKQR